ncbi:TPA: hypothetical protein N0F65_006568 [Lagenidium giganteum]|uniref:DDE Tnp4 domain-containing protein n=1 Tax=Lagenidium giganteum TaxID=4803 RepID=A0AAV2YJX8_9STRA|nr:TPA: hypothetical protein N0F65_006568 [Lagenidium giganteum]
MRFTITQICYLAYPFSLGDNVVTSERDQLPSTEALVIVCQNVAERCRWIVLQSEFYRSAPALSRIFSHTVLILETTQAQMMRFHKTLLETRIDEDASSGTRRENLQRAVYSWYKRRHCLAWQAVCTPDGMCIALFGPMDGRRHDAIVMRESRINEQLARNPAFNGKVLYGDGGYTCSGHVYKPRDAEGDEYQATLNSIMSSRRLVVEWLFEDIKMQWPQRNWYD